MFHFYLGTLRYIQQFRNAATHNDSTEDENISELAIHYLHAVQEENRTWPGNLLQFIKNTACLFFTRHHGYEN